MILWAFIAITCIVLYGIMHTDFFAPSLERGERMPNEVQQLVAVIIEIVSSNEDNTPIRADETMWSRSTYDGQADQEDYDGEYLDDILLADTIVGNKTGLIQNILQNHTIICQFRVFGEQIGVLPRPYCLDGVDPPCLANIDMHLRPTDSNIKNNRRNFEFLILPSEKVYFEYNFNISAEANDEDCSDFFNAIGFDPPKICGSLSIWNNKYTLSQCEVGSLTKFLTENYLTQS